MLQPLGKEIGDYAVQYTQNSVFPSESWEGNKWADKKKPNGNPILVKSGRMKASVKVLEATKEKVRWGVTSDITYAKFHQEGTPKMPKRQFIGLDKNILKFAHDKADEVFKKAMK